MPQNKFAQARYRLIDQILRKQSFVKTSEIVKQCKNELGMRVSNRTVQMDMETLKNDPFLGFYLPICYCHRRKAYYYDENASGFFTTIYLSNRDLLQLYALKRHIEQSVPEPEFRFYCTFLQKLAHQIQA